MGGKLFSTVAKFMSHLFRLCSYPAFANFPLRCTGCGQILAADVHLKRLDYPLMTRKSSLLDTD